MPFRTPMSTPVTTPAGVFLTLTPLAWSGRRISASSPNGRASAAISRILILQDFLDEAARPACLEGLLGSAGKGHADAVDHRFPDAADPGVLLGHVALVLDPQPGAAAEQERQVRQGVARFSLNG